jgi:hypothetical protein
METFQVLVELNVFLVIDRFVTKIVEASYQEDRDVT